jgi:hypothetical protein
MRISQRLLRLESANLTPVQKYSQEGNMGSPDKLPVQVQDALNKGLLKRLPVTFLPFVNQQLNQWEFLFPNERRSVEGLLLFVAQMSPEQSNGLFHDIVQLEDKMGVRQWEFSTTEQTIQNSSLLARSPYFQDWRRAVQTVFDAADRHALDSTNSAVKPVNRLVLIDIPRILPLDPVDTWRRWQGIGKTVKLNLSDSSKGSFDQILTGVSSESIEHSKGLLDVAQSRSGAVPADTWIVDAGRSLADSIVGRTTNPYRTKNSILLSYLRSDTCRQNFSHEMNTMRKDLADADAVFDHLRKVDIVSWCPPEVAADSAVREFLRTLYLTGNGAVIFGNSFVQWGASEAIRRARPSFLAAKFGVRSKPKPFTGVAVFDNPDQVNPLPAVDDFPGSAVDAQILAHYIWLAASRYEEYQHSTACVCIAENISQAYVVAPPEFSLGEEDEPLTFDRLSDALRTWIA